MTLYGMAVMVLVAWGCAVMPPKAPAELDCELSRRYFVLNHGTHTGIAVASEDLLAVLPELRKSYGKANYIEMGWGDDAFYRAPDVDWGLALRAVLWPTSTVLHVLGVTTKPADRFPHSEIIEIRVSESGYRRLIAFIADSFARSPAGSLQLLGPGPYENSRFYRATGTYFAFYTCNTWVADAVQTSGIPVSTTLVLTAEAVMTEIRETLAARQESPSICD